MIGIIYTLVARGEVPLSQHSVYLGTFKNLFRHEILRVLDGRPRSLYSWGPYYLYCLAESNVRFLVLCGARVPQGLAFAYLDKVKRVFFEVCGRSLPRNPMAFESHYSFRGRLVEIYNEFTQLAVEADSDSPNIAFLDVKGMVPSDITPLLPRGRSLVVIDPSVARLGHSESKTRGLARGAAVGFFDRHPYLVVLMIGLLLLLIGVYFMVIVPICGYNITLKCLKSLGKSV